MQLHSILPRLAVFLFLTGSLVKADDVLLSNLPSNDGAHGEVSSSEIRAVSFTTKGSLFDVTAATLRLSEYNSSIDIATLTIRLDDSNAPSSSVFGSFTAPASASDNPADFVFTPTSTITLAANTKYWLVIEAASDTNTFRWMRSNPTAYPSATAFATFGTQDISYDGGDTWEVGSNGPHSFAITGVVPEPSVVGLCLLGGALLFGMTYKPRSSLQSQR